jgi:D-glycero-beta-D-manno-heptose 1-phosphate adenylyltransferase
MHSCGRAFRPSRSRDDLKVVPYERPRSFLQRALGEESGIWNVEFEKILSEAELVDAVARDRADGKTIAFANGCFDLLHVGHVRYLQAAAAEGDRLVVAVNDDRSVAALKGEGRPILPAADRAELVAALRAVDYVVVFGDATVERLLLRVKPDVHCKGTDYTVDTVPERAVVASYGGRTAIVGDSKRHATRELLKRIAGS